MDSQKQQVVTKLKEAKNVLVTVSADPSVDQLAACLGLTLMLNKLGKHATAVFSGEVPSTIEFLKPEATLETNTNSLRDFIIALDRNKADKLRYKVEDKVVRIFITPYKTSINQEDLEFSEGDFNVDVVVALGVKQQQDIDQAVTAQGNILHDATVITITTSDESALGSIHWRDPGACGVSELAASLSDSFDKNVLDEQIATAFLTGIVAQTERFSNNLTTSNTMKVSAQLMSAGANQQLVATKLDEPPPPPEPEEIKLSEPKSDEPAPAREGPEPPKRDPGLLEIDHNFGEETGEPEDIAQDEESIASQLGSQGEDAGEAGDNESEETGDNTRRILRGEGPNFGQLTASTEPEPLDPSTDPLSLPPLDQPMLNHETDKEEPEPPEEPPKAPEPPEPEPETPLPPEPPQPTPELPEVKEEPAPQPKAPPELPKSDTPKPEKPKPASQKPEKGETLADIETSVHSPHISGNQPPKAPEPPEPEPETPPPEPPAPQLPSVSVDANGTLIHHDSDNPPLGDFKPAPGFESASPAMTMPQPPVPPPNPSAPEGDDKDAPPPVPPPMVPFK